MPQTTQAPVLSQVNLVARDLAVSIAFHRLLGLTVEEAARPEWVRHHATAIMPNGSRIEFDSIEFARQWNPGFRQPSTGTMGAVLFFGVPSREQVDLVFRRMTAAGHASQQPPQDAFWGSRYAIVEDPDGHAVGIMSPVDPARRCIPPPPD